MTETVWQTIKVHHCERIGESVELQAQVVYPADQIPDQSPRIVAHRCNYGDECNLIDKPACVWAGTNPTYDPFEE
jgi:hypothetical protein